MPLEKIRLEEALALGIGEPSFAVYLPTKQKQQSSALIESLIEESKNETTQNADSNELRWDNG